MIPPLRSFDDVDGNERGQKKTDDLRAMTALGPRTLPNTKNCVPNQQAGRQHLHQNFRHAFYSCARSAAMSMLQTTVMHIILSMAAG